MFAVEPLGLSGKGKRGALIRGLVGQLSILAGPITQSDLPLFSPRLDQSRVPHDDAALAMRHRKLKGGDPAQKDALRRFHAQVNPKRRVFAVVVPRQ